MLDNLGELSEELGKGFGDIKDRIVRFLRAGCLLLVLTICGLFYQVKGWFEQWFPEHTWIKVFFLFAVVCFGIYCIFVFIRRTR